MKNEKKEVKKEKKATYEDTKEKVMTSEFSLEELLEIDEVINNNEKE